jgi:hypothetical protein
MAAFFWAGYGDVALPGMALDPLLVFPAVALLVALLVFPIAMISTCEMGEGCRSNAHSGKKRALSSRNISM